MEYKAIECQSIEDLNVEVNKLISDGWRPIGGVSVSLSETYDSCYFVATQAMILNTFE